MCDEDYLEERRRALKESVAFFSPERKLERENWIVDTFLKNLVVEFSPSELAPEPDEPPDVRFRDAQFELKELMDPGRRRYQEYRDSLVKAQSATDPSELLEPFTPRDATASEIYADILGAASGLLRKYPPVACANLDLLFYVNYEDVMGLTEVPFPDVAELRAQPWRSVSFIIGHCACVLATQLDAPSFLRAAKGKIVHRPITGV
ncbi:MAG: hypothetical protein EXR36_11660 [Betaproteobacteria bacterium]|nr:hypothetical protein [Betaproteobacteria bacterium]